jgi:PAS domain S-box-containing protein
MGTLAEAQEAAEQLVARAEAAAATAEQAAMEARHAAQAQPGLGVPQWNGGLDSGDSRRPLIARSAGKPQREPRRGFDDVDSPLASIRLDGHFGELNPAFCELVGYAEQEFQAASWPPVADRANLSKHREQLQRMLAGEIASARVNTGYVHAQGLLVPVVGQISLVRDSGQPSHFLLEVETG